jgi:hypothetical protein
MFCQLGTGRNRRAQELLEPIARQFAHSIAKGSKSVHIVAWYGAYGVMLMLIGGLLSGMGEGSSAAVAWFGSPLTALWRFMVLAPVVTWLIFGVLIWRRQTAGQGYWFMIKDKLDPCGFAYISNQAGLIFRAEPIR